MEMLRNKITAFLQVSKKRGYGYGYGDGHSSGNGSGYGNGNGYGDGDDYGNGYGSGNGRGITKYNGNDVYIIDDIATIITNIKYNIAQGYILRDNVILVPCYIVKINGYFAHGETAKEAYNDALAKYQQNQPLSERIADFIKQYPTLDTIVKHEDLYRWHNILTGSCRFGRLEFCKAHGIDPEQGTMTIEQFVNLTADAYGGEAIKELKKNYI